MKTPLLSLLLVFLSGLAIAETKVLPSPGNALAILESDESGSQWSAFSIDFDKRTISPVKLSVFSVEQKALCLIEGTPGSQCAVTRFSPSGQQREMLTVVLGGITPSPPSPNPPSPPSPTPPTPTPPTPTPVPPTPVPPTPVSGPRVIVLLLQSGSQTAITSNVIRDLRQNSSEKYLRDNNYQLYIGDEDNPVFSSWRAAAGQLTRPVLMIADPATNRMLYKEPLTAGTTADNVIELIKRHGG